MRCRRARVHRRAPRRALQLVRQEGRVSDDDDRTTILLSAGGILQLEADRNAGHMQLRAAAAIALHQHAQRVAAGLVLQLSR